MKERQWNFLKAMLTQYKVLNWKIVGIYTADTNKHLSQRVYMT